MVRRGLTVSRPDDADVMQQIYSINLTRAKLFIGIFGGLAAVVLSVGAVLIGATKVIIVEPTVRQEVAKSVAASLRTHEQWASERVQTLQLQLRDERQIQLREERAWTEGRIEGSKADLQRELQQLHEQMRDLSRKVDQLLQQRQSGGE